jgi:hypothetical protein
MIRIKTARICDGFCQNLSNQHTRLADDTSLPAPFFSGRHPSNTILSSRYTRSKRQDPSAKTQEGRAEDRLPISRRRRTVDAELPICDFHFQKVSVRVKVGSAFGSIPRFVTANGAGALALGAIPRDLVPEKAHDDNIVVDETFPLSRGVRRS